MEYKSRDKECHRSRSEDNLEKMCSGWNNISGSTFQDQESAVTKSSALLINAGRKQSNKDLYKEDLVQSSGKEDLIGMVMEIAGDSDLDSCTSDSEDEDDSDSCTSDSEDKDGSESLCEGHARVIWANLAETIEKIDDILVVDRRFLHGEVVASVSDPSGQTGTITKVDVLVDLKAPDGEIIRNVDAKKIVRVGAFEVDDYVIHGCWLGMVEEVDQNVTVLFKDNAKCKIRRPDSESLVPISQNPFNDEDNLYYPGQLVCATTSKVFKDAQWLKGKWKPGCSEGIISSVEVKSVYINWLASALPSTDTQTVIAPEKKQDPKKLTLLSHFLYASWQLGDWCLLPSNAKHSLKPDFRSDMTDVLHNTEYCSRVTNHSNKLHKKEDDIEQVLFVLNTRTKVDVLWQDGSRSFSLDSHTLFSVEYLGDQDFWPGEFVLEKGHDDDVMASHTRRIGVVKNVDSKERIVTVKWVKPKEHPRDLFEFEEEVVSVYELDDHPDYSFCIGEVVVRVSSVEGTLAGSANVNNILPNEKCQSNLESKKQDEVMEQICGDGILGMKNVKGGGTEELYLSCFGYIIGLKDGEIEVAWADGRVSKVGPQDIIIVDGDDDDDDEDSSDSCSEVETDWDDKDVVSRLIVVSHGVDMNGKVKQVDASLLQIDTSTQAHHLLESNASNNRDGDKAVDDSVLVDGEKLKPAVWASKDYLIDTDCKVEHQCGSVRESLDDLGVLTSNTVKKQEQEDGFFPDVYDHGNGDRCFKQFDSVNDSVDHFFSKKNSQSGSQRQWIKKVQQEWASLENNLPDTIYVRVYEDRIDLLWAAIIGAAGTPYQDGLFFFDIHLPSNYPHEPPSVHYHSCGSQLNPNLSEDGTLCLSLLNTWTGRGNEAWKPENSSILQVLVSIQGLVLNEKPFFNEAGYDKHIGRAEAEKNSGVYNEDSFLLTCKSMLCLLRKPPKHFELFVKEHFRKRGHYILAACNSYMKGAQVGSLSGDEVLPLNDVTISQCSNSSGFRLMLAKARKGDTIREMFHSDFNTPC